MAYSGIADNLIMNTHYHVYTYNHHLHPPPPPPPHIHGGEMQGIPGDIGGNSMSILPEICPGVGNFPRFSLTILIALRHSSATTHTPGTFIQMTSALHTNDVSQRIVITGGNYLCDHYYDTLHCSNYTIR